ncbi:MAG: hypothetical protein KAT70_09710, partial [Thermoplasmata archaeon]|nr:hypothetical protein [Thermoplasmata archaeon]
MRSHGCFRAMLLIAVLSVVMLTILPFQEAEGAGVGVWNSPPTFVSMEVRDDNDTITLILNASDYNGWEDIFRINVKVTNETGGIIQEAIYQQYNTNTSNIRTDEFTQPVNSPSQNLIIERCRVKRFFEEGWFLENTTQQVTFYFKPFGGMYLHIEIE